MREQEERHHPIDKNMRVQRATWAAERVAWALWFLLIAATLAGFASNGRAAARARAARADQVRRPRGERAHFDHSAARGRRAGGERAS